MLKQNGSLVSADWESALNAVGEKLKAYSADQIAILTSPQSGTEDQFALSQLAKDLGGAAIDHRLRTLDADDIGMSGCSGSIEQLSSADAALIVGSQPVSYTHVRAHETSLPSRMPSSA